MLNQTVLVGRLINDPIRGEKNNITLKLAIPRSYKNQDGDYETDFIKCLVNDNLSTNVLEYCKKGDLIGIKGRLESDDNEIIIIVAEKITFLSSKK